MVKDSKKIVILEALKAFPGGVSLPELLKKLNKQQKDQYKERSLRRWLSEMIDEKLIFKKGAKRGTKYYASITEIKTQKVDPKEQAKFNFSKNAAIVIKKIQRPLFERDPVTYNEKWLKEYKPNQTYLLSKKIREALYDAGRKANEKDPAGTFARIIYNRLLIDLSFNSSRLEGNTYSLLETKKLILDGVSAEDKLDEEKIMIINHKEAIRYLVDNAVKLEINEETVLTVHFILSDGLVAPENSGHVRKDIVRISSSTYAPFEDRNRLKSILQEICIKASEILDPYEQSIFTLIHISYLQAFFDVNKRTSRLCANIPLIKHNLTPLSFNDIQKKDYIDAMIAVYEHNDPCPMIELYQHSYFRTCKQYEVTIEAIGFDEVRVKYRTQRREIIRHIISKMLVGKKLHTYINSAARKIDGLDDYDGFIRTVEEDLKEISPHKIAGLGVTKQQLEAWVKQHKTSQ